MRVAAGSFDTNARCRGHHLLSSLRSPLARLSSSAPPAIKEHAGRRIARTALEEAVLALVLSTYRRRRRHHHHHHQKNQHHCHHQQERLLAMAGRPSHAHAHTHGNEAPEPHGAAPHPLISQFKPPSVVNRTAHLISAPSRSRRLPPGPTAAPRSGIFVPSTAASVASTGPTDPSPARASHRSRKRPRLSPCPLPFPEDERRLSGDQGRGSQTLPPAQPRATLCMPESVYAPDHLFEDDAPDSARDRGFADRASQQPQSEEPVPAATEDACAYFHPPSTPPSVTQMPSQVYVPPAGVPPQHRPGEVYLCTWRKPQFRKHKTWDGDAFLLVDRTRHSARLVECDTNRVCVHLL